jgi:hypothetical protein
MHQWPQAIDARAEFGHFLGDILVLPGLRDREDGKVMHRRLQVIDKSRLVFRRVGEAAASRSRATTTSRIAFSSS